MKNTKLSLLTAALALAAALTLSCGEVNDGNETHNSSSSVGTADNSSSGVSSSSRGNPSSSGSSSSIRNPSSSGRSSSSVSSSSAPVCGSMKYNPETQRCNSDNIVETKCGESYYISKMQYCSNGIVKNKETFTDDRDGQTYTYVVIGSQTWMAENLNYKTDRSFCYGDMAGNDVLKNCPIYGRLYDWAAAMALPKSCNAIKCPEQINEPHQGVCPDGWHVPTDDEWGILMESVEPSCTDHAAKCDGAGLKLKAAVSWSVSGDETDEYGFSALAGGRGHSDGSFFENIGEVTLWWSTAEGSISGSFIRRYADGVNIARSDMGKTNYFNLRCVQN